MIVTCRRGPLTYQNLMNLHGQDEAAVARHLAAVSGRDRATWLGLADGVEACAVGLTSRHILDSEPYLWLLYTKICEQHPLRFVRWSRKVVDEILTLYPSVIGLCDYRNDSGRRWLEWLGARFDGSSSGDYRGFRMSKWP